MRLIGLLKVRNEDKILKETLDHWGKICTGGIYIFDDVSLDKSLEICRNHPSVKYIFENKEWDYNRERHEHVARQTILTIAKRDANLDDWFVYFDADERLFFNDWKALFDMNVDAIACRLYDVYITPEDEKNPNYNERVWVGPEFRTITFFFRNSAYLSYDKPDQRMVNLPPDAKILISGIVKHYGKGLSVDHWEETCDYYINYWPKYSAKWQERKGKAVHNYVSDFGNKLIKFNDVISGRENGFSLEAQTYGLK